MVKKMFIFIILAVILVDIALSLLFNEKVSWSENLDKKIQRIDLSCVQYEQNVVITDENEISEIYNLILSTEVVYSTRTSSDEHRDLTDSGISIAIFFEDDGSSETLEYSLI